MQAVAGKTPSLFLRPAQHGECNIVEEKLLWNGSSHHWLSPLDEVHLKQSIDFAPNGQTANRIIIAIIMNNELVFEDF